ncbi:MAG TPA: tetratricopeptide repeat protein [Candidatus Aquilonibacter sp.]|nr:tetratricopeptide repeat protein [Candidatus Aquilonibacter sp.]
MKFLFTSLFVLAVAGKIFAADTATDFNLANKLYAEGKFSEAADYYEKILQTGAASPNLLFNYGNAEYKAGNLGKAIAAYRRAELLAPRDEDVRANLAFVRNQVQNDAPRASDWFRLAGWLGQLTLNEWALLAAAAFWLTFLLLATRQIRPALGARLKGVTIFTAMLAIFFGAALGLQAAEHFSTETAVVTAHKATALIGPFDDAQTAFDVHDGAELSVLDHHGDWLQVSDGPGKIGWLQKSQVEVLPGA